MNVPESIRLLFAALLQTLVESQKGKADVANHLRLLHSRINQLEEFVGALATAANLAGNINDSDLETISEGLKQSRKSGKDFDLVADRNFCKDDQLDAAIARIKESLVEDQTE